MKSESSLRPPFSMDKLEETHHRAIFPRPPRAGPPRPSVNAFGSCHSLPPALSVQRLSLVLADPDSFVKRFWERIFRAGQASQKTKGLAQRSGDAKKGFRTSSSVRLESLTYVLWRPSQAGIEPLFFAPWRLSAKLLLRAKTRRRKETVGKGVANGDGDSAQAAHPRCITGNP